MRACLLLIIFTDYSQSFVIGSQSEGPSRNNIASGTLINGERVDEVPESTQAPSFVIDPQLELEGQSYSNTPTRASVNDKHVGEGSASTPASHLRQMIKFVQLPIILSMGLLRGRSMVIWTGVRSRLLCQIYRADALQF